MELKKGQTIMMNVDLDMSAAILHDAVSNRSGMPPEGFAIYYQSKQLEGEAALSSWGVEKDATIEVKTRGRGGAGEGLDTQFFKISTPDGSSGDEDAGAPGGGGPGGSSSMAKVKQTVARVGAEGSATVAEGGATAAKRDATAAEGDATAAEEEIATSEEPEGSGSGSGTVNTLLDALIETGLGSDMAEKVVGGLKLDGILDVRPRTLRLAPLLSLCPAFNLLPFHPLHRLLL